MDAADLYPEILRPYDARRNPLPPPIQGVCDGLVYTVCVNEFWWSHLSGQIARLLYRDAWEGTDDEIDDAIQSISKILDVGRPTMSCGCGCGGNALPTRITSAGVYQVSYDGGITWVDAPQLDPRTNATLPPPIPGADGNDKKCKAANNIVRQMKDIQAGWSNKLGTGLTLAVLVVELAGVAAAIFLSGGTLAAALAPVLIAVASAIASYTGAAYDALFTSDVWDYCLCQFYCNASPDGTFTQAAFNTIVANFDSHFSGDLALSIYSIMAAWQLNGLNIAARFTSTDNLDCSACTDCPGAKRLYVAPGGGTEISWDGTFLVAEPVFASGIYQLYVQCTSTNPQDVNDCAYMLATIVSGAVDGPNAPWPCGESDPVTAIAPIESYCANRVLWRSNSPFRLSISGTDCP